MWRSKKFIIIALLVAIVAIGSISGVALAQGNEDKAPAAGSGDFMARACAIYEENTGVAIDQEALKEAFAQAQSERQAAAREAQLAKMVENGLLSEEQAQELQEWWESRPDVPVIAGFGGNGMFRGGFGQPAPPEGFEPPE
jgi:hypothetical protein